MDVHYYQFYSALSQKPKPMQQDKEIKILRTEKKKTQNIILMQLSEYKTLKTSTDKL